MRAKALLAACLLGLLPGIVRAEAPDEVLISQVQVSGISANDEFIEIRNYSDHAVSLKGWSLQYKPSSGSFPLSTKKNLPDIVMPPGGYYLIAHSDYAGSVAPDLSQSTISMSGSGAGATIFLVKDQEALSSEDDSNIADKLAYGSSSSDSPLMGSASLPAANKALVRVSSVKDNSLDFAIEDSRPRNSSYIDADQQQGQQQEEEHQEEDDAKQSEQPQTVMYSDKILISEIMPNPAGSDSGGEWVELFNSSEVDMSLKDWILDDSGSSIGSSAVKIVDEQIAVGGYLVVNLAKGKFALNNTSADSVRLFSPDKVLKHELAYSPAAPEQQSWCNLNGAAKWCEPTPGQDNKPLVVEVEDQEEAEEERSQPEDAEPDYSAMKIQIIEIMPDPDGADPGNEYVRLINSGNSAVSLKGWILDDGEVGDPVGSTSYRLPELSVDPSEETEILIPKGRFALNNSSKDGVRLFAPDKSITDFVSYDEAIEGVAYAKVEGTWMWLDLEPGIVELPRSGLPLEPYFFVLLLSIWYIGYGHSNNKRNHEQTRSDRRVSS